ncbi:MAG: diguanylate cyclase [Geminicoccaceae bacterium]
MAADHPDCSNQSEIYPLPANEGDRLRRLQSYGVLDTAPEEAYDRVTRLIANLLKAPIALVSLTDERRQWFKSNIGAPVSEIPRHRSFCGHAVYGDRTLVVEDASMDERFADNPLVTGPLGIRFYAGAILRSRDGFKLGTLCALDSHCRKLPPEQQSLLEDLAEIVSDELELRLQAQRATEAEELLSDAYRTLPDGFALFDSEDRLTHFNDSFAGLYSRTGNAIHKGARFEEILRDGLAAGQFSEAVGREAEWLETRLEQHDNPDKPVVEALADDRWVQVHESRTSNGGRVSYRIDVTESRKYEELLKAMAWTDPLTGLLNRRRFLGLGNQEINRARRKGLETSVFILDVDHFKAINDTYGHDCGDAALVHLADLITDILRDYDLFGRYGGEEFVILAPDTNIKSAQMLAGRILSGVSTSTVITDKGELSLTVSIGIARCDPSKPKPLEHALSRADAALYKAKISGRNRAIAAFEPEDSEARAGDAEASAG